MNRSIALTLNGTNTPKTSKPRLLLIHDAREVTGFIDFARRAGFPQRDNPSKLQSEDIAHMIQAVLEMNDRGFTPELSVFATNPVD